MEPSQTLSGRDGSPASGESEQKLFSADFVTLCLVSFFAFCNLSIFYGFAAYLERLGIPPSLGGLILGLEPMTAFLLRPIISMRLHAGNALKVMLASLFMVMISLLSYRLARNNIPALILLRVFHGAAFVLLVSSSMEAVVHFIPRAQSGRAFGLVSVTTLLPYAIMPLLTEWLLARVPDEARIYAAVSLFSLPAIALLVRNRRRIERTLTESGGGRPRAVSWPELKADLKVPEIARLLLCFLLLYLTYASVFFYVKQLAKELMVGSAGHFFTLSTAMIIATRVLSGKRLDRLDRRRVTRGFVVLLSLSIFGLAQARSPWLFYPLAMTYGLCIGFIFPLLNAELFSASPPERRGLNTNLSLFMMDAGFFTSPYLLGALQGAGLSVAALFELAVGSALLAWLFLRPRRKA